MKSLGTIVSGLIAAVFLVACAATPPMPPAYTYGKDQININIDADARLNQNSGSAHTLLICVHQLRDPNAFNRLAGDTKGIYQLLECSQFDPSVTNSKRIIVQPDQKVHYSLDRAEGTKYVAIVAGYYNIRREDVIGLYEIPIVERSLGMFSGARVAEPGVLNIKLNLGPRAVLGSVGQ